MTLAFVSEPVTSSFGHISVLRNEVVQAMNFDRPALVVDGTLGLGGHSEALLEAYPAMKMIGLEWDAGALEIARRRLSPFANRFTSSLQSYAGLLSFLKTQEIAGVDGVLLDLGLSSKQLSDEGRGFSFQRSSPLDMRMSPETSAETAWDLLVRMNEEELAAIFRAYAEEPHAWRIANFLKDRIRAGTLSNDALQIAEAIKKAVPFMPGKIHPATRCFQALRIAVNHELDHVDALLAQLPEILRPGGRAAILSFHSLEDRKVKTAFQKAAKGCVCPPQAPQCVCGIAPWAKLIPRKAIQASEEERNQNPRARSARLRVLEKL